MHRHIIATSILVLRRQTAIQKVQIRQVKKLWTNMAAIHIEHSVCTFGEIEHQIKLTENIKHGQKVVQVRNCLKQGCLFRKHKRISPSKNQEIIGNDAIRCGSNDNNDDREIHCGIGRMLFVTTMS